METCHVAVGDGTGRYDDHEVASGTTMGDLLKGSGAIAARLSYGAEGDPVLVDLARVAADGDRIEPVAIDSPDGLAIVRHSTAHVLAQAVQGLFPGTRLGIGPPIENGFYYDFDVETPFTHEDLQMLEKRMREIVKQGQLFRRRVTDPKAASEELAAEPYKLELINDKGAAVADGSSAEIGGEELTIYDNLDPRTEALCWKDLCRGPHVPSTRQIPAFKLLRSAGAYWRGSERNPQLQRIYGTAWQDKEALAGYLHRLEEAERRDHRRLGTDLDLFSFPHEIGSGLAVFHPKGGILRREMEDYSRRRHEEAGYEFVYSPHISKSELFETSGHLQWFADGMFPPIEIDEGHRYYLKPMNCPFHILIFRSRQRSYRELPLRLFEFGSVYRYEKSGVVHGLTRVRGMTQDDAHIFCTRAEMTAELTSLLDFVLGLLSDFGLSDFYLELSTKPEGKAIGSDEDWDEATEALRQAAQTKDLELVLDEGGGAFYGPKISVQARDAIGRTWQMSTIQLDFQEPARFGLEYVSPEGTRERPIMIHRALFGSVERFVGVLVEHYAGAFPAWLAPVQVIGIPVSAGQNNYLEDVAAQLRGRRLRPEVDTSDDRMQKKIRNAQRQKVPYMLIAGPEDQARGTVSFRFRDGSQRNFVPVAEAIDAIAAHVESRSNAEPS
jgi:threonyl-tRNA synthetase